MQKLSRINVSNIFQICLDYRKMHVLSQAYWLEIYSNKEIIETK